MPTFIKRTAPAAILVIAVLALATVIQQNTTADAQTSICADTKAVPADASAELLNDCDALINSKGAIKGSGSLNWWAGKSMTQWNGITVSNSRVTGLDLRDRGLDGTIPERIAELDALQNLYLSGNTFTGCIPAGLSDVPNNDVAAAGLSFCDSTGEPNPTPPAATPTPPPTPQSSQITIGDVMSEGHCNAEDINTTFGEPYTETFDHPILEWDHNGRGWSFSYITNWLNSTETASVFCRTVIYDNTDSAILDTAYHTIRLYSDTLTFETLLEVKIDDLPEIGEQFIGIRIYLGDALDVDAGAIETNNVLYGTSNINVFIESAGINHPLNDDRVVTIAEHIDARLTALLNDTPESIELDANGITTASPATHVRKNVRDNLFAGLDRPVDLETLKRLKALDSTR